MLRRKRSSSGKVYIVVVSFIIVAAMSVNIYRLYNKNMQYSKQEAALTKELEEQIRTKEQLDQYESYIGSKKYIEDSAKNKLGLIYENEIIFREK